MEGTIQRWYCKGEHREDITELVLAALEPRKSTVFRHSLPLFGRRNKQKRLQIRCSDGHLNVIVVD